MTSNPSVSPGLRVEQLSLWRGERCLFQNLSFELHPGELMHLTGPNGVGKTSLLRVICGLTLAEDGHVFWNDQDTRRHRPEFLAALSYAGHKEGLKDELSAGENLKFGLALRGIEFDEQILVSVGLTNIQGIPVGRLSAGQRRRVMLARVLAAQSPLWILDEPFSNLDQHGRELLNARLVQHVTNGGLALLTAHQELVFDGLEIRHLEMTA